MKKYSIIFTIAALTIPFTTATAQGVLDIFKKDAT